MSTTTQERSETATKARTPRSVDMKLEIVVIPVSDVDGAKRFYGDLGWRLDADFVAGDDWRVIQFTPPGSSCSVIFGKNVTAAAPGSAQGLYLIVSDVETARNDLLARGVKVSEIFHAGGKFTGTDEPYLFGRHRKGRAGSPARELSVLCLVQRSRRQWLAVPGDHGAIARTRRGGHDIHLVQ
jgi:catechol 2,3-dioxygenase-like lactoylglutathione lyase family enzyme